MNANYSAWRPEQRIRPIVIGVVWRADKLLLAEVCDDNGRTEGWRPLGGGIEFGERAAEALKREFTEELNKAICEPTLLTVMENHFEHYGMLGHEVAFVFETSFADPDVYRHEEFQVSETGMTVHAEWKSLAFFEKGNQLLYPEGLLAVLVEHYRHRQGT